MTSPIQVAANPRRIEVRIVETGEVFKSVRSCARHIHGHPQHILDVLAGARQRKSYKGYTFEVVDGGGLITDKEVDA